MNETALLPDGVAFPFWDDATKSTATYHVAQRHPRADDANPARPARRSAPSKPPGARSSRANG